MADRGDSVSASEEFLFHIYRGAELLRSDQVHEAKSEIETALRMQPRDQKGQDLLAAVYFRLGMYPRAIDLYQELVAAFPAEIPPRINLALAFLKTGQAERARDVLEHVVQVDPQHTRAWAYLGLAFERLRDYEKARIAFERAGQKSMARKAADRVTERTGEPPPVAPTPQNQMRLAMAEAFYELDAGEVSFTMALPSRDAAAGPWQSSGTTAESPTPGPARPSDAIPKALRATDLTTRMMLVPAKGAVVTPGQPHHGPCQRGRLRRAARSRSGRGVRGPRSCRRSPFLDGCGAGTSRSPSDRLTGRSTPFSGASSIVLGCPSGKVLQCVELAGEFLYVRESALAGLDRNVAYENGRLATGEGGDRADGVPARQWLRDFGAAGHDAIAGGSAGEHGGGAAGLCVGLGPGGWCPRVLAASESPGALRGHLAFTGEGGTVARYGAGWGALTGRMGLS